MKTSMEAKSSKRKQEVTPRVRSRSHPVYLLLFPLLVGCACGSPCPATTTSSTSGVLDAAKQWPPWPPAAKQPRLVSADAVAVKSNSTAGNAELFVEFACEKGWMEPCLQFFARNFCGPWNWANIFGLKPSRPGLYIVRAWESGFRGARFLLASCAEGTFEGLNFAWFLALVGMGGLLIFTGCSLFVRKWLQRAQVSSVQASCGKLSRRKLGRLLTRRCRKKHLGSRGKRALKGARETETHLSLRPCRFVSQGQAGCCC